MKLYELTGALAKAWRMAEDDDADLIMLEDTLQSIEAGIEVKADGIAKMLTMLEATASTHDIEIKRLQQRKRAVENRIDSIKKYLRDQMLYAGMEKIKGATHSVSIRHTTATEVFDVAALPAHYVRTTILTEPDKRAIKDVLQSGVEVPGARLVENISLQIR